MVTLPGVHPPPPGIDSLLGDDEEDSRGPEWCVDLGDEIRAMNKFELWLALGTGDYVPGTLVWRVGRERWQPARDIPELACALKVHHQTLLMAARAAEQAGDARSSGEEPGRRSRASLPRILTPESSVLVAELASSIDADTPAPIANDVDATPSAVVEVARSTPPVARRRVRSVRRPIARFATAIAAVAGTLVFLLSRGDMRPTMTSAIAPVVPTAEVRPDEPVDVVATPTSEPGQFVAPAPSVAREVIEPKRTKKESVRKRVKDGVNGVAAGIEADRRGQQRKKRAH